MAINFSSHISECLLLFSLTNNILCYNIYFITISHLQNWFRLCSTVFEHSVLQLYCLILVRIIFLVCEHMKFPLYLCNYMFSYFWQDGIQCNSLIIGLAWNTEPFQYTHVVLFSAPLHLSDPFVLGLLSRTSFILAWSSLFIIKKEFHKNILLLRHLVWDLNILT